MLEETNTGDNQNSPSFVETLPETFRDNESFKDMSDVGALAQAYMESTQKLSELQESMPQVPEDYKFDQKEFDKDALEGFKSLAKESKMSQEGFDKAIEFYNGLQKKAVENYQVQQEKTEKEWHDSLRKEFGDKFDQSVASAVKAIERFGGEDLKTFLNETRLGNHPLMVKTFKAIGEAISEDSLGLGGAGTPKQRPVGVDGRPTLVFPSMQK